MTTTAVPTPALTTSGGTSILVVVALSSRTMAVAHWPDPATPAEPLAGAAPIWEQSRGVRLPTTPDR